VVSTTLPDFSSGSLEADSAARDNRQNLTEWYDVDVAQGLRRVISPELKLPGLLTGVGRNGEKGRVGLSE
jgi:hypothetical protein